MRLTEIGNTVEPSISAVDDSVKSDLVNSRLRSAMARRNIIALLVRKGLGVGISFLLVPLTLAYLGPTNYGVWLTVTSVISWMNLFDFGLGNGMRNKVAEALAKGEREKVRVYVSTSYAILAMISASLFLLFLFVYSFIPWALIFQTPLEMNSVVGSLVLIVFTFFCLQFLFGLINTLLIADQRPAAAGYLSTIGSALSLLAVYLLMHTSKGSIELLAFCFGLANLIPLLLASVWLYRSRYREFRPTRNMIDYSQAGVLLSLGVKFFFLQTASIIIYSTNNVIIAQLFGPEEVAVFGVAFKYMSIITMTFAIVLTPFWSAFTDAYHRGDIVWIQRMMKRLMLAWCGIVGIAAVMVVLSGYMFKLWIGDTLVIPFALTTTMGLYVVINAWNSIFSSFQNGLGVLKLQLVGAIIGAVSSIPLAILFGKNLNYGVKGVLYGTIIGSLLPAIWAPIQYKKIMNGTATGIWAK